jgi:hypothetical protein
MSEEVLASKYGKIFEAIIEKKLKWVKFFN